MERCNAIIVIQRIWRRCMSRKYKKCSYCLTKNDGFHCGIECNGWFPPMFGQYDDYDGKLYEKWLRE